MKEWLSYIRFDLIKKEKEERRNRKVVEVKDIQLSPVIDIGDLNTKARKTREILEDGNKVKVTLIMRGRQQAHPEIGFKIINEFFARVEDIATQEKAPTREGRTIMMVLAPSKKNK